MRSGAFAVKCEKIQCLVWLERCVGGAAVDKVKYIRNCFFRLQLLFPYVFYVSEYAYLVV